MSSTIGQGHTETTAAYYLEQVRKYITQNLTPKTASNAYTPAYGVDVIDTSTVTDSVTTSNPGAPAAFMVTGDKTNQKLFLEFEEDIVDASDNSHVISVTGSEQYSTGPLISLRKGQKSFTFDGSTDLTSNTETDYDIERTNAMSISFWARWTSASNMIFVSKMTATANTGFEIGATSSGNIRIRLINTATSNEIDIITPLAYNDGSWHSIVFTKGTGSNAAACQVWVDRTSITMTVTTDNLSATMLNNIDLCIGAYDGGTGRYTGRMFDFQFWNVELSSTNVLRLGNGNQISHNAAVTTPSFSDFCVVAA